MAILSILPGVEVIIRVDGEALQEWDNNEDDGTESQRSEKDIHLDWDEIERYQASRTISKFMRCTTGKAFTIYLSVSPPFEMPGDDIGFDVCVDGHRIHSVILSRSNYANLIANSRQHGRTREIHGVEIKRNLEEKMSTFRVFEFAAVEATEGDNVLDSVKEDAKRLSKVGRIEVRVQKLNVTAPRNFKQHSSALEINSVAEVHEKALKGSSKPHGTILGSSIQKRAEKIYGAQRVDCHHPLAIYSFSYRSKKALRSLQIIRDTPEPDDAPDATAPLDPDGLTEEQRDRVKDFMQELRLQDGKDTTKVKREKAGSPDGRRNKRPRMDGGSKEKVVLDLTGDSD